MNIEHISFLDALVALLVSLTGTSVLVALLLLCSVLLARLDADLLAVAVFPEVGASAVGWVEDLTVVEVLEEVSSRLVEKTIIKNWSTEFYAQLPKGVAFVKSCLD